MLDEKNVKQIVGEVLKQIDLQGRIKPGTIPVGVSGRHIHLAQDDLETLFGPGYKLKVMKDLSQPGQFAAEECVMLVGKKGVIEKCRILGPVRKATQIEISVTDSYALGIPAVVRDSGDTKGSPGVIVVGPKGAVNLKEGVIVAARHLHMHTREAEKFGLKDMDRISIKTSGPKAVVFCNVLVRVNDQFALDFHIDTDEANAGNVKTGDRVEVIA